MKTKKLSMLLYLSVAWLSCESATEPNNAAPEIIGITVTGQPIIPNSEVSITAIAIDSDGDSLQYFWSSDYGQIRHEYIITNPTRWRAPREVGIYEIVCLVSDGKDTDSETVEVEVVE